jgi:hypothetical protein
MDGVMSSFSQQPGTTTIERPDVAPQETESDLGHWRNRWHVPDRHAHLAKQQGALPLGDGTWLGSRRFDTSEEAERHAARFIDYNRRHFDIRYLGTEFFPDY